jgi:hypothetical protein
MTPQKTIAIALSRCTALESKSLEEFLDTLLDENLETLALMPGTPGQVMAAQFTHYVRSSVDLTESLRRNDAQATKWMDTIVRLPSRRRARTHPIPRREVADGADTPRLQTSAA